jgi:hypothetical protein
MANSEYKVSRKAVEQIIIKGRGGSTRITVSKFNGFQGCDGGSLAITGDFGPWEYTWSSIGSETFGQFLFGLDKQYAMQKLAGSDYFRFDPEATEREIKRDILELRRDDSIDREKAREFYCQADEFSAEMDATVAYCERPELLYGLFDGDPIVCKAYSGTVNTFWDEIWPLIVREILASEKEKGKLNGEPV